MVEDVKPGLAGISGKSRTGGRFLTLSAKDLMIPAEFREIRVCVSPVVLSSVREVRRDTVKSIGKGFRGSDG